ncbi:MAG TPA: ABC transporter substrate-binding protein, partial [Micromonosporaceae bacterium]
VTAACSPTTPGTARSGEDTLIVARTGDIDLLDPSRATAFQTVQSMGLVYDTLVDTDDKGDLVPGLAQSWDTSDPERLTLTLRDGVSFHNGTKLAATDAKATLDRNLDQETGSVVRSYLLNIGSIETPDPRTVAINLKRPDASLLTALSYTGNSVLAKADIDAGKVGKEINGTGPFRWRTWQQGQKLTLTANQRYWNGAPKLKTVEFRVIPDETSIVSGMKAGSFHLGTVTDPAVARQVTGSRVKLIAQATTSYHVLQLNARRGPLKELAVRQAIACAVDRKEIVDSVYFGRAELTGPITSPAYRYDATAGLPCEPGDLTKAKRLLADAGHAKGFSLKTIVMLGEYNTSTNIAQVLQSQLGKIGVKLDLDRQQTSVYVPNWLKGKFDAAVALNGGSTDPYLLYNRYFTSDGSLTVPAGYGSERLDGLLREGNATTDPATRQRVFGDLQRQLLHDSPWVWLFRNQVHYVISRKVSGFKALPTESLEYLRTTSLA